MRSCVRSAWSDTAQGREEGPEAQLAQRPRSLDQRKQDWCTYKGEGGHLIQIQT